MTCQHDPKSENAPKTTTIYVFLLHEGLGSIVLPIANVDLFHNREN